MASIEGFVVSSDDPRAPSREVWDRLTPEQRDEVVERLPAFVPYELIAPEGDLHVEAKITALQTLDAYFKKIGRKVYLSTEIGVYYPGEPRFAPDLLAVLDVETHPRMKWVVAHEGRGLDFVLEVVLTGELKKDLGRNVDWFARLGIPEYFVFDRGRRRLNGFRLREGARAYEPILPQGGSDPSGVLGLELTLEAGRLRFLHGSALLPETAELVARLEAMVDDVVRTREEERRQAEAALAEERRRAEEAERRVAELTAELERLRGER